MTTPDCPREPDVVNAIVNGRRAPQCDETLQAHLLECRVCTELVEVASMLRLDRDRLQDEMSVPSPGQVWWRSAIRARLEASQQVARPLSWLLGVSVAVAAGLAITVVELLWSPVHQAFSSGTPSAWTPSFGLGELVRLLPNLTDLAPLTSTGALVLLGAAACLVLAPLALYFALSDE